MNLKKPNLCIWCVKYEMAIKKNPETLHTKNTQMSQIIHFVIEPNTQWLLGRSHIQTKVLGECPL